MGVFFSGGFRLPLLGFGPLGCFRLCISSPHPPIGIPLHHPSSRTPRVPDESRICAVSGTDVSVERMSRDEFYGRDEGICVMSAKGSVPRRGEEVAVFV